MNLKKRIVLVSLISGVVFLLFFTFSGKRELSTAKKDTGSNFYVFVDSLEKKIGGKIGVYARNLHTGKILSFNGKELFPTASAIKLPILITLLKMAQEGKINLQAEVTLTDTNKWGGSGILQYLTCDYSFKLIDAAQLMIILSDNSATNLVIDALAKTHEGKLRAVNDYMASLGLKNTILLNKLMSWKTKTDSPQSVRYGVGVSTPEEMGILMEKLVQCELLDSVHTESALEILGRQEYNSIIPRFLPAEGRMVRVYHKTGSVTETRVDVGYVVCDSLRYVIALFADQFRDHLWTSENEATIALARISRMVWNEFMGETGMERKPNYSQDYYPYPGGIWLRLRLKNAPFPHPGRKNGYSYKGEFYSAEDHYSDSSAVVIIPDGFHPVDGKVDLLVHFHGWKNDALNVMGEFRIPQQLKASGRNLLFVIVQGPYRAPDSFAGKMEDPGGFKSMVKEILYLLKEGGWIDSDSPGNIILSGHSGGYRAVAKILSNGDMIEHIREIFLFDAFYAFQDAFLDFARKGGVIRSIYTDYLSGEHEDFFTRLDSLNLVYSREWYPKARLVFYHTDLKHNEVMDGVLELWLKNSVFRNLSDMEGQYGD